MRLRLNKLLSNSSNGAVLCGPYFSSETKPLSLAENTVNGLSKIMSRENYSRFEDNMCGWNLILKTQKAEKQNQYCFTAQQ